MNDLRVAHWTGAFGVACVVLWLSQLPLFMIGSPPSVYDGAAFGQHLFTIKNIALTRVLLAPAIWLLIASISMIRKRETIVSMPRFG